jgi:transcription factor C subunit 3
MEMRINWGILAEMLGEDGTGDQLKRRWNHVRRKFGTVIKGTEDKIREVIASAYESNTEPHVNFDNLGETNWPNYLNWVLECLPRAGTQPRLPATREELDANYEIVVLSPPTMKTFYEDLSTNTIAGRRGMLHKQAYVVPLHTGLPSKPAPEVVLIARTHVRAMVATPELSYNEAIVQKRLDVLGEKALEEAVKTLRSERKLTQERKRKAFCIREYDFSENCIVKLSNNADAMALKDAARFKNSLDLEFAASEIISVDPADQDGAFLAMINMTTKRHLVTMPGSGFPGRSGLLDYGYQTRKMDKSRLMHEITLEATETYRNGHPLDLSVPPPRPEPVFDSAGNEVTKIPMWFDINGNLLQVMWDVARAITAVMLNRRPFLTPVLMADALSLHLEEFEVRLVLGWLMDVGAAEWRLPEMPVLKDWWWMCLADRADEDDEDRGNVEEEEVEESEE